jgi:hypothetical protein
VDMGLAMENKAWVPPQLSGSYTKDNLTGWANGK